MTHTKKRVNHTDEEKRAAVALVRDHFWKRLWVAERYNVTIYTVYRWEYETDSK